MMLRLNKLNIMHRYINHLPYRGAPKWHVFDPGEVATLPPHACCYVVVKDGKALYVGQTINLRARFYAHNRFPKGAALKAKFGQRFGDWAMREARLIERLRPPMNIRGVDCVR